MQLSDRLSGLLAAGLGLAVVLLARTFPPMPGQDIGPGLFPTLAGVGLIAFGTWLIIADRTAISGWVRFDEWARRPRMVANFVVVILALVVYALLVTPVGFFLTSFVFLAVLTTAFGVPARLGLPTSVVVTLAIHYVFYSWLRVPLPWGVLEGVAW
jgi:putative tricarboxylic transport membrane protein